MFNIFKFSYLN